VVIVEKVRVKELAVIPPDDDAKLLAVTHRPETNAIANATATAFRLFLNSTFPPWFSHELWHERKEHRVCCVNGTSTSMAPEGTNRKRL
jgi:hypothetical protein